MRDDPAVVDLVERARGGDQGAWDQVVDRYAALVFSVCRRFRLTGADTEDVTATVWLRLVERIDAIREPAALPGWIATTARRECLRVLRGHERQVPVDDDGLWGETPAASDEWLIEQERQLALRIAFAGLPVQCRRLLALLFTDPPTPYREIADELGMPIGGVGPNRARCLDRLRDNPAVVALMDVSPTGR
ncbi:RNA polymerase sigma factor [Amycolatopsis tolypomycina]|uniref:RNA polymerase sigma factor, sigma-70 family n=1 Tax=Amycolatopsis tolypomycina TaxID=208445 RepID=A0A1H4JFU7_9PSEU|nr:sigma-70 family RNA polymerase sigma factor [Amycolatopsis tolypomycina]SEB44816.1 RNA polymerase sigma factor, sigma-70 family [Amycolatopsis tolypomycina]